MGARHVYYVEVKDRLKQSYAAAKWKMNADDEKI